MPNLKKDEEPPLMVLSERLKQVSEKFKELKACGVDEEILIAFLQKKTGLSQKDVKLILKNYEAFYDKLATKYIADNI